MTNSANTEMISLTPSGQNSYQSKIKTMLTYQTPNFMADLLEKVQALQLTVLKLNDGHSLHVDSSSTENFIDGTGFHASFDVTLFDRTDLVKSWDFSSNDDAIILNRILEDLTFHISRL